MSRRRSWGLVVSCLSILSGCGSAPSPSSIPAHPLANASPQKPSATPPSAQDVPAVAVTNSPENSCGALHAPTLRPLQPGRGDRVVIAKREQTTLAFVANEDDAAIHTIDLDKRDEIGVTQLPGSPSALLLLNDGRLVVTLRDRNEMLVMEADASSKFETRCRLPVASEPVGLASVATNDKERLVVTAGYGHALGIVDAKNFTFERWVDLTRDPRAVVIANGRAFVSHMVSADMSVVNLDSGQVDKINIFSNKKIRSVNAPDTGDPLLGGQGFALAMNERGRLWAPMVMVDPGEPKITSAYGSAEIPIKPYVGVIDLVAAKQLKLPVPESSPNSLECLLPRAASALGDRLFVTCLGSDELVEMDGRAQNAAEFLRRRVQVARGPLGLALDGKRAVVMSQFDRVVSIVDIDDEKAAPTMISLSRPEGPIDEAFERGRQIFHDGFEPRVSKDGRACASCHPDGREDSCTWSTPDGPRQTISLAGRISNAGPYGWFGDHPDVQSHLKHTVGRLGGQGFDGKDRADLDALVTYISRMKAPVAARNETNAALISKGHDLFHAAAQGCGECHAEGGTDRAKHDIGTGRDVEAHYAFDTPSLLSLAGSAPYFHDGRYKTIDELLAKADDKMGHAKHLKPEDRVAMVAYMESLSPAMPAERPTRNFVRPTNAVTLPAFANTPVEKLALRQSPLRKAMTRIDLDLEALPVVEMQPQIKYDNKNPEPQGGEVKKLIIWNGQCASVPYHSAAHLMMDWSSAGMTRLLERCVSSPYEDGVRVWRDMTVQTIDPLPNGRLHFEEYEGYFQLKSREFRATRSTVVDAVPIGNGLVFAFRAYCGACTEGLRDRLYVVTPSSTSWGDEFFGVGVFYLDPGESKSLSTVFNLPNLERWKKATKVDVQTGSTIGSPKHVIFRMEATRLFSEDKPKIAIGRAACVADDFSCK